MSFKKDLDDKFKKNELKTSKSRLFFISPVRVDIIAEPRMFFACDMHYQNQPSRGVRCS